MNDPTTLRAVKIDSLAIRRLEEVLFVFVMFFNLGFLESLKRDKSLSMCITVVVWWILWRL